MDPENSANTTTDPRAHVMTGSVEELPAGLFHEGEGEGEAAASGAGDDEAAVGLDTEEREVAETDEERAEEGESEEAASEAEAAEADDLNDAPEFWSAEDKAAWATVPPALRPILQKYEKARVAFEQEKVREAAQARKEAAEQVEKVSGVVEQAAKWWQANGQQFFKAFGDKWAQVDWKALAADNPAEYVRMTAEREADAALLRQAHEQGQRDIEAANKRAHAQHLEARRTEHEKIAAKMPDFFGTRERADKTYKELGDFLASKGIPTERINATYEAPLIELAVNAMRFEKAQKQASAVVNRDTATGQFTARTAPKRVQPGPALNRDTGDRNADAARRAGERFRKGNGADVEAAAEYARRTNLFA